MNYNIIALLKQTDLIVLTILERVARIAHINLCLILNPVNVWRRIADGFACHEDRVTHFNDASSRTLGYNRKACGCFIACNEEKVAGNKGLKIIMLRNVKNKTKVESAKSSVLIWQF